MEIILNTILANNLEIGDLFTYIKTIDHVYYFNIKTLMLHIYYHHHKSITIKQHNSVYTPSEII